MSTYASNFPIKFLSFLQAHTGFKKENFTSTRKLENVIATLNSINVRHEVHVFLLDIVKIIMNVPKTVKKLPAVLANKFLDVFFLVVECLRKYVVTRVFLRILAQCGSGIGMIIHVLLLLTYYLSDFITCEMLTNLKNYIKNVSNNYILYRTN